MIFGKLPKSQPFSQETVIFYNIVIKTEMYKNFEVKGIPSFINSNMNIVHILTSLKWGASYNQ